MIGTRRGWGGSFRFEFFARETMTNTKRQNKTLITATLFSDIPLVIDDPGPPRAAKRLDGDGEAKRGVPKAGPSGAALPSKGLAGA